MSDEVSHISFRLIAKLNILNDKSSFKVWRATGNKKTRPESDSDAVKPLVKNTIELEHYLGSGQQIAEGDDLR